ncbi:hypothetical protein phiPLPE_22 [Iodobacter phage PhiPLPE]|uniref:Uncharacterized protein n=1 Tax=Iodobacter phage PhiPLPE TaxID=551895 RepID=B5AX41_9CAUD|nr:hypothetical protein phiPLPE_22 [Iodobacter phage PhiPLPE]ACG60344.1 hypothetical protein phiPLPE_22 [Iodobacter phage PhiPLPE]
MIEFDASKVVVEVNGVEVIGFGGVRPTMPTDTEMLDWMIENWGGVRCVVDGLWGAYSNSDENLDAIASTPRAAIAAAMAEEAK